MPKLKVFEIEKDEDLKRLDYRTYYYQRDVNSGGRMAVQLKDNKTGEGYGLYLAYVGWAGREVELSLMSDTEVIDLR